MASRRIANNDPWAPLPGLIAGPGVQDEDDFKLGSKKHIATLEAKLKRVKGRCREPTSKEMISCLAQAKDAHMKPLINDSITPYISAISMVDQMEENTLSAIQRKIQPQKHALTEEELKFLLENDELKKVMEESLGDSEDVKSEEEDAQKKLTEDDQQEASAAVQKKHLIPEDSDKDIDTGKT